MKNKNIFISAIALSLFMSCGQKTNQTEAESQEVQTENVEVAASEQTAAVEAQALPSIAFESEVFDFGEVKAGSVTEKEFKFTNKGEGPLIIKNATASCGCTVPEYSKEAIAPGESGMLKLSFSAPQSNGMQSKTVTLTTNTAGGTENYRVSANVVGGQNHQPAPPKPATNLPKPNLE